MLPLAEAREVVTGWNQTAVPFVPLETVEECMAAFARWQIAIACHAQPDKTLEYLQAHNEFARRIPDELLLMLFEAEDDD